MWIAPQDMARSVFNTLSDMERTKIKNNLSYFGYAIFQKFNYDKAEAEQFLTELSRLLNGGA